MSLVSPDSVFLLWSILVALVAVGFWSEQNTRIGRYITGIIVAMAVAMALSNMRIIPFESEVYGTIFEYLLPIAIPLTLFRADLVDAFRHGGATVVAFCIGSVGIVIGAYLAAYLLPLGDVTALVAGFYSATYIGGSANLAAVAIAADYSSGSTLTSIVAADVVATNFQTLLIVALPSIVIVRRFFGYEESRAVPHSESKTQTPFTVSDINLTGAALAISVAMLLVFLGAWTAESVGRPQLGIVVTTVYALVVSNFMKPLVKRMSMDFELGLFMLFLFLVALAAGADLAVLIETGVSFFVFAMFMLVFHTLFIVLVCRVFRLDLRSVVIGSTACIGGMTTAAAIASAKGWRDLIIPGILAGTIGSSVGTLIGVWVWSTLS